MRRRGSDLATVSAAPTDSGGAKPTSGHMRISVIALIWVAAAIVGVLNSVAAIKKMPDHGRADSRIQVSATAAASAIAALPTTARVLLLWPADDRKAITLEADVGYLIYPRRYSKGSTDQISPDLAARFDAIVALGAARTSIPPTWRQEARSEHIVLAVPASAPPLLRAVSINPRRRIPLPLGILGVLACLAAVYALGAMLITSTLLRAPFNSWPGNLAAAHLVGAAAIAWLETAWIAISGQVSPIPTYVALAVLFPVWRARRRWPIFEPGASRRGPEEAPAGEAARIGRWLLFAGFAIALLGSASRAVLLGVGGDATRIWQFKARAFWMDGSDALLRNLSHRTESMMDYPLLVPIQSWWAYVHLGSPDHWVPQLIGALFFIDLLVLFAAHAARYVPTTMWRLALVVLAAPSVVTSHVTSGWAEIPFAAFFLGIALAVSSMIEDGDRSQGYLAAWFAVGLVATKNEGLQAVLAAVAVTAWWAWRRRDRAAYGSAAVVLGAGAVAYLPWFAIKQSLGIVTDIFDRSQYSAPAFSFGMLTWRLWYSVTHGFLAQIAAVTSESPGWGLAGGIIVVGLAYRLLRRGAPGGALWGIAGLQLAGYVGVYMITPMPFLWHVNFSSDRLALHVFPALLLGSLVACFAHRPGAAELDGGKDGPIDGRVAADIPAAPKVGRANRSGNTKRASRGGDQPQPSEARRTK